MKIIAIHRADAYYSYRDQLIGLNIAESKMSPNKSVKRGYQFGHLTTRKKVRLENGLTNEFFFFAVKVK